MGAGAAGHMYKLVVNESKTNRFHANGSQYMDQDNQCLGADAGGEAATKAVRTRVAAAKAVDAGLGVPPSCAVCSEQHPCLYDVILDPRETNNLGAAMPQLAAKLRAKLATFTSYVPPLSAENLACYNCTGLDPHSGNKRWGAFWGPCCVRR